MGWWRRGSAERLPARHWEGKDFYALLGVGPDATADEIKRATRLQLRQLLPDNPTAPPNAEELYRATHEAFEMLRDPALRREYNDMRRHVVHNDGATAPVAAESEQVANDMTNGEEVTRNGPARMG